MKEGVVELSDGRSLGYGWFGSPDAPPVIYCHGFPTNRIEFEVIEPVLTDRGIEVQVLVLDRPGYGKSTFQPKRTLLDWPQDVAEAADVVGFEEFAVLGVSGGGPYALACAHVLGKRVTRLGVAVGMGPAEATGMGESLTFKTSSRSPLIRRFQFGMFAAGLSRGREDQIFEKTLANMGTVDRPVLERPEMREWFMRMMSESLEQGGRPAALEAGIYRNPWGFDPASISTETFLWYGGLDETVPASVGEWLADRIPNATYELWPQHGHFTWMETTEAEDVLAVTAGQSPRRS